jgi:hypothetical protein
VKEEQTQWQELPRCNRFSCARGQRALHIREPRHACRAQALLVEMLQIDTRAQPSTPGAGPRQRMSDHMQGHADPLQISVLACQSFTADTAEPLLVAGFSRRHTVVETVIAPVSGSSFARKTTRCGAGTNSSRAAADGNSSTVHGPGSRAAVASEKTPVDRYLRRQTSITSARESFLMLGNHGWRS